MTLIRKLSLFVFYAITINTNNQISTPNSSYSLYFQVNELDKEYNAILENQNHATLEELKERLSLIKRKAEMLRRDNPVAEDMLKIIMIPLLTVYLGILTSTSLNSENRYWLFMNFYDKHDEINMRLREKKLENENLSIFYGLSFVISASLGSLMCMHSLYRQSQYELLQILLDKIDINLFEINQKIDKSIA